MARPPRPSTGAAPSPCRAGLKAIYSNGGLPAFIKAVLDSVSWWDFLWMVAQVTLELIGLLVPGLEEALVLAKCVLLTAQLIQLTASRPPNCPA